MPQTTSLEQLNRKILNCRACPRLVNHCRQVAVDKRAAYKDQSYHGRPVPNFTPDNHAAQSRVLIVGLAPGAHGANRTGRMFTGDRSGDFLFAVMHQTGFASQPQATHVGDGLALHDCVITAAAHCAPPGNKPTRDELANCRGFLDDTFDALTNLKVVIVLGRIALDAVLKLYHQRGWIEKRSAYKFAHAARFDVPGRPVILCAYHPSQQNTYTGRLTAPMLAEVFEQAGRLAELSNEH